MNKQLVLLSLPTLLLAGQPCEDGLGIWGPPKNSNVYPKWHYCNRPTENPNRYGFMDKHCPPAPVAPHVCTTPGWKLRTDSEGIMCSDYSQGDEYTMPCVDSQCCVPGLCSDYTCKSPWVKRADADSLNCEFECNEEVCCDPPPGVPKHNAEGFMFVDRDPGMYVYGGQATIIRAIDESDITHYRVYWGHAGNIRKVPSCNLYNPISWMQNKFRGKLYKEFPVTGCDITFEIPMGTDARDYERCPLSYDLSDTNRDIDPCNPTYFHVITVNQNGEKPLLASQLQQNGPMFPIADYNAKISDYPCAQTGVTMGHDLPGPDDVLLAPKGTVGTWQECQQLCKDYPEGSKNYPCRWWTWAVDNGGATSKSCWLETQVMYKQRLAVRVIGPPVCPTSGAPTGKELPRCDRWKRLSDTNIIDNIWAGAVKVLKPTMSDIPMGPYESGEYCKALCDIDVLCLGFAFMKGEGRPDYYRKHCFLLHMDDGTREADTNYDSWLCSREGMSPLINGYDMQPLPFGYKTCDGTPSSVTVQDDHDCCAALCDADKTCVAFTFLNVGKECRLFSSCDQMTEHKKVEGCAWESCFNDFGGVTYKKELVATYEIIDRKPLYGGTAKDGLTVYLQAGSNRLEDVEVACVAGWDVSPSRAPTVGTYEEIMSKPEFAMGRAVGTFKDSTAKVVITQEPDRPFEDGEPYMVRCAVQGAAALGSSAFTERQVETAPIDGWKMIGVGYCKDARLVDGCVRTGFANAGTVYTATECRAICEAHADCKAFFHRATDGHCGFRGGEKCTYYEFNSDPNVKCWVRGATLTWETTVDYGECAKQCDGSCAYIQKAGDYTRNFFLPVTKVCQNTDAPTLIPTAVPVVTAAPTPAPVVTAAPTPSPTVTTAPSPAPTNTPPSTVVTSAPTPSPVTNPPTESPVVTTAPTQPPPVTTNVPPLVTPSPVDTTAPTITNAPTPSPVVTNSPTLSPVVTTAPSPPPTTTPAPTPSPVVTTAPTQSPTATPSPVVTNAPTPSPVVTAAPTSVPTGSSVVTDTPGPTAVPVNTSLPSGEVPSPSPTDEKVPVTAGPSNATETPTGESPKEGTIGSGCDTDPCGPGQVCEGDMSGGGFTCTCQNGVVKVGGSANCNPKQCDRNPCGSGQECSEVGDNGSFECRCQNGKTKRGKAAVCEGVDECDADPAPCGKVEEQTCNDPDYLATGDYECTCVESQILILAVGSKADCMISGAGLGDDDDDSVIWPWILAACLVLLAMCGAAAFWLYRKRQIEDGISFADFEKTALDHEFHSTPSTETARITL